MKWKWLLGGLAMIAFAIGCSSLDSYQQYANDRTFYQELADDPGSGVPQAQPIYDLQTEFPPTVYIDSWVRRRDQLVYKQTESEMEVFAELSESICWSGVFDNTSNTSATYIGDLRANKPMISPREFFIEI